MNALILTRATGEGDHNVVEGALPAQQCGPSAPSVGFAATSPARCRYG